MDECAAQNAVDHLEIALAILDADGKTALAAQIDHVIQVLQASIAAASGTS